MSTMYFSDPAVFEQERARVGGNWEAYFAKHPDLRGIPGFEFPGTPDQPVSPGGWDSFGLFFAGITAPSDENKLKVAQIARNWFQLLFIWLHRLSRSCPIDHNFLMAFGNDYAARYDKDPQVCCSVDLFIVMFSFMEARKKAIGRLFDPTGFERLHYFVDACIRETMPRAWALPNHIHHIFSLIRNQPDGL
ncbi:DNA binding protein [Colletotrichum graminicola]|nr:DNA binding protein [Colletotrichum graminicola]